MTELLSVLPYFLFTLKTLPKARLDFVTFGFSVALSLESNSEESYIRRVASYKKLLRQFYSSWFVLHWVFYLLFTVEPVPALLKLRSLEFAPPELPKLLVFLEADVAGCDCPPVLAPDLMNDESA